MGNEPGISFNREYRYRHLEWRDRLANAWLNSKTLQMYSCQWHLEIVFGKQKQALEIMKAWGEEKFRSTQFKKSKNHVMVGHIGESPSYIIDEYLFESLDDFTQALEDVGQPQFKQYADAIAPLVVPGSQKWIIYKLV